jgi:hypothetical protein
VQRPFGDGRVGVVAEDGFSAPSPILHRGGGVTHRQRGQVGDQLGFVFGEQADGAVLEVHDDGLDLPTREHTVAVGGRGHGELTQAAGGLGAAGGLAARLAGVVAQPPVHGSGAVVAPYLGSVVFTDRRQKLGIEPIRQHECFGQHNAIG